MKKIITGLSILLLSLFLFRETSFAQNPASENQPENKSKKKQTNQLIAVFKNKPTVFTLSVIAQKSKKVKVKYGLTGTSAVVYEIKSGSLAEAITELSTNPEIEAVFPDHELDLLGTPNDLFILALPSPGLPKPQWNMFNANLVGVGTSAWDITRGSSNVVIAIIDSGVDSAHEDLAGKFTSLVDCSLATCTVVSSMTANPNNADEAHGTHVAGLAGAATNNNLGIASSGFASRLMIVKVRNSSGQVLLSYLVNAIRYAADHGARIINMSIGALIGNLDGASIALVDNAVAYAWGRGTVLVAAAGNCGRGLSSHITSGDPCDVYDSNGSFVYHAVNEKFYPAASPNVIAVAALDINNILAVYSERNDAGNPAIGNWISVAAPGGNFQFSPERYYGIASTWPRDQLGVSQYYYNLGTSFSAPHVAGVAALILAVNPSLTNAQLKSIIENSANHNIAFPATKYGALDALAAVRMASGITSTPTPPAPSRTLTPTPTRIISVTPFRSPTPTSVPCAVLGEFCISRPCCFGYVCNASSICSFPPTVTPTRSPTPVASRTPTPGIFRSPTPTIAGSCPRKSQGDADCDGKIDLIDFEIWRREFTGFSNTSSADYSGDGLVDLIDFEIWRRNLLI